MMEFKKICSNSNRMTTNCANNHNDNNMLRERNHRLHETSRNVRKSSCDGSIGEHLTLANSSRSTVAMSNRDSLLDYMMHNSINGGQQHNKDCTSSIQSFIVSGGGGEGSHEDIEGQQQRRQKKITDTTICSSEESSQDDDNENALEIVRTQRMLNSAKLETLSSSLNCNKSNEIFTSFVPLVHNKSKYPSIKHMSNMILIIILATSSNLFMSVINAKEIDSKQDLQEEESTNLPAEHRTYLTGSQGPNIYHQVANSQNRQQYMTTSGHPVLSHVQGIHHHPQTHQAINNQHQIHSGSENHVYIESNNAPVQPSVDSNIYTGSPGTATGAIVSQATSGDVGGPMTQQSGAVGSVSSASDTDAGNWPLVRSDLPHIRALNVKCEKNHMTVNIVFDRAFYGLVFSKGHYSDTKCVHLPPNSGQTSVNFDIHLGQCGMSSSDASGNAYPNGANSQLATGGAANQGQPNGLYIENTIIIQYDAQVQEIWDQARKLRCTWYDYYEKSVTFRPYNVDMLDAVTANFLGDNIQCWMQIQVGKGPWQSEVAGIVKIGQTMTMVLAIKDDENKFDMLVRNCVAHDGNHKHQPIQLVDEYGCVARPKIMARFQKVRNFGSQATVVSYAYFQAFKFPDSMNVHFQCVIQVCRHECPEPACSPENIGSAAAIIGGSGQANGDYATSGTEIVTHKEPLPSSMTGQSYHHHHGMAISTGPVLNEQASSGIQTTIKMDENQGRAQVKLDTTMVAGSSPASSGGALPPHLLHSSQAISPIHQVSKQYSKPQMLYANMQPHSRQQHQVVSNSPGLHTGSPYSTMIKNNVPMLPQQHQANLISSHNGYTNRQGELDNVAAASDNKKNLIMSKAMPRSMRSDENAATSKTKTPSENKRSERKRRQSSPDDINESTNVRTMKTIQVVSPGDVAFSLISNPNDTLAALYESIVNGSHNNETSLNRSIKHAAYHREQSSPNVQQIYKDYSSTICFTTTRFLFGITISLILLTLAVCSAVFVLIRQKSKFHEKMSSVDDSSSDYTNSDCSTLGTYHLIVGVTPGSHANSANGRPHGQHKLNNCGGANQGQSNLRHLYQSQHQQQQFKNGTNHINQQPHSLYQHYDSNSAQQAQMKKVGNLAANKCGNYYGLDGKSGSRALKNSTSTSSTMSQSNTPSQAPTSNRVSPR